MPTLPLRDVLRPAPDSPHVDVQLFHLWEELNALFEKDPMKEKMDAALDQKILALLTPRERKLYDLPQQDVTGSAPGLRSGDLAPRHKHLVTILLARRGQVIAAEWDRIAT